MFINIIKIRRNDRLSAVVALNHSTLDFLIFITLSFALDNSTCYIAHYSTLK